MEDTIPLSPELTEKLYEYGRLGREALEAGKVHDAESHFLAAWNLIPEPRLRCDLAGSMAVAITEFYRDNGLVDKAMPWLELAREAYGPEPNPHTEFLAASVYFEADRLDEAYELFDCLYQQYRRRPFEGENPRYLAFYLDRSAAPR